MNRPLLIILLVLAAGLLIWRLAFQEPIEPVPNAPEEVKTVEGNFSPENVNGIKTDEEPEFNVVVEAFMEGSRSVLEFSITETHGWAVTAVIVEAFHGFINEETGEWERNPDLKHLPQLLCRDMLDFGQTLVAKTTLTGIELERIGGELGTSENWQGRVYGWGRVYKPKQ